MKSKQVVRLIAAATLLAGATLLLAQQPGFTRKLLQDHDLSAGERHGVQVLVEFVPGGAVGKHNHPGEELGYVLEGTLELNVVGQAPHTLKAGEAFFVPAGVGHEGEIVGSSPAKGLANYIIEEVKAVASP